MSELEFLPALYDGEKKEFRPPLTREQYQQRTKLATEAALEHLKGGSHTGRQSLQAHAPGQGSIGWTVSCAGIVSACLALAGLAFSVTNLRDLSGAVPQVSSP